MDGDGDFLRIHNMEASDSAVPDWKRPHLSRKSWKMGGRRNSRLVYDISSSTGEDNDRSILAEDQDSEQDSNYDEHNASDADSSISQESKSQTPSNATSSRTATLPVNSTPKTMIESSHLDFHFQKKKDRNGPSTGSEPIPAI